VRERACSPKHTHDTHDTARTEKKQATLLPKTIFLFSPFNTEKENIFFSNHEILKKKLKIYIFFGSHHKHQMALEITVKNG